MYMKEMLKTSFSESVSGPSMVSKFEMRRKFPNMLGVKNKWGVKIHEVQINDSRQALQSLLTCSIDNYIPGMKGATIANYTELLNFKKDSEGKIVSAVLKDKLSGKEFVVKSKIFVNCTGVHADTVRKLANPECKERIIAARGAHVTFAKEYLNENEAIIIPQTTDGRLIFVISYNGKTMAGTTDVKTHPHFGPSTVEEDVDFICENLKATFGDEDIKSKIEASWTGIRPLVLAK